MDQEVYQSEWCISTREETLLAYSQGENMYISQVFKDKTQYKFFKTRQNDPVFRKINNIFFISSVVKCNNSNQKSNLENAPLSSLKKEDFTAKHVKKEDKKVSKSIFSLFF